MRKDRQTRVLQSSIHRSIHPFIHSSPHRKTLTCMFSTYRRRIDSRTLYTDSNNSPRESVQHRESNQCSDRTASCFYRWQSRQQVAQPRWQWASPAEGDDRCFGVRALRRGARWWEPGAMVDCSSDCQTTLPERHRESRSLSPGS